MLIAHYESAIHGTKIAFNTYPTSVGQMQIGAMDDAICFVAFACENELAERELQKLYPTCEVVHRSTTIHQQVIDFLEQKLVSYVGTVVVKGTAFQWQVWQALTFVNFGKTATYSDIAQRIGKPQAMRAIGNAIGQNAVALLIPCHRIVLKNGGIGGFRWGNEAKIKLLEREQ